MKRLRKRIIVAGAGLSGLTAAAYLLRAGHEVLVIEKSAACGGLVSSFRKDGFLFDTGPRAFGNAGILAPMLADLGINLTMVKGEVSTGISDHIVHYDRPEGVEDFLGSLRAIFPESAADMPAIGKRIRSSMRLSKALNRVPNPFFRNVFRDPGFFFREFLPLMPGFLEAVVRTGLADQSIEAALASLTANRSLSDMICQHYFKGTPASFVFGYFENFQDYVYPLGGTGRLPEEMVKLIESRGGEILTNTEIREIHPAANRVVDQLGVRYPYDHLVWCTDLRSLYGRTHTTDLEPRVRRNIQQEAARYAATGTGESVFTLFLGVDQAPEYFARISRGHFIYTPSPEGLGDLHRGTLDRIKADFAGLPKQEILNWLSEFCRRNSYEISIPVLKDPSLAPAGKTGLVVSLLMDGELVRQIAGAGWYDEFKHFTADCMLEALESSVYPGLRSRIVYQEIATPRTLMERFNTTNGAITGWSMEERPPVPHNLAGVMATPKTAIPGVCKAGQWAYSPAGVPVAILTGRIAASAALRGLRST